MVDLSGLSVGVSRSGGESVVAVVRWGLLVVGLLVGGVSQCGRWGRRSVCGVWGCSWLVSLSGLICGVGWTVGRSVCGAVRWSVSSRSDGGQSVCSGLDGGQLEGLG